MSRRRKPNSRNPSGSGRPTAGQLAIEMDSWLFKPQEFRDALAREVFSSEPGVEEAVRRNLAQQNANVEALMSDPRIQPQLVAGAVPDTTHIPSWIRLSVQELLLGLVTDETRTCPCGPRELMATVQPLVGAAWKPHVLSCAAHGEQMLGLVPGSEESRTCDVCGRLVADDSDDPMLIFMLPWGELIYEVGTCTDCKLDYASPSP